MRLVRGRLVAALLAAVLLHGCTQVTGGDDEPASDAIHIDANAAAEDVGDISTLEPRQAANYVDANVGGLQTGYETAQVEGVTDSEDNVDGQFYSPRRYRERFDEDDARQAAESDLSLESYRSIGRPYGCTEDCSGHEAGFKYRARKGYGSRIEGDYDARSFRQGQQAYDDEVDRKVEEAREAYEDNADQEE